LFSTACKALAKIDFFQIALPGFLAETVASRAIIQANRLVYTYFERVGLNRGVSMIPVLVHVEPRAYHKFSKTEISVLIFTYTIFVSRPLPHGTSECLAAITLSVTAATMGTAGRLWLNYKHQAQHRISEAKPQATAKAH
jgi:hypothetical protein